MMQDYLIQDLAPLKLPISAGMRLAGKEDMKLASPATRPDPDQAGDVRVKVTRSKFDKPGGAHKRDVTIKFKGAQIGPGGSGGPRGTIRGFTLASRRRLSFAVRNTADLWDGFLTLTYPAEFPTDGRAVKRHLNAFCSRLRREKVAYLWILEFQKRGAPHFHFLVRGWLDKKDVAQWWTEIVNPVFPSEREKMLKASTRIEGIKNPDQVGAYMTAYMNKLEQKVVPKEFSHVGRFWGSSRLLQSTLYRSVGLRRDAARAIRTARKWYEARNQNLAGERVDKKTGVISRAGFRWKWRGHGFILIEGAGLFKRILLQAMMHDQGRNVWKEWDGEPDKRAKFLTPADKLELQGQMLIDGGYEPLYPRYSE